MTIEFLMDSFKKAWDEKRRIEMKAFHETASFLDFGKRLAKNEGFALYLWGKIEEDKRIDHN